MEKNTILAIVLSGVVLLGWYFIFPPQQKGTVTDSVAVEANKGVQASDAVSESTSETEPVKTELTETSDSAAKGDEVALAALLAKPITEDNFNFKTDNYDITLSNRGARITSIKYGERSIELAIPYTDESGFNYSLYLKDKLFLSNNDLDKVLWFVQEQDASHIVFAQNLIISGKNVRIQKKYTFNQKQYFFNLSYSLINSKAEKVYFPEGKLIFTGSDMLGPKMKISSGRFNEMSSVYSIDGFEKLSKGGGMFSDATDLKKEDGHVLWAGMMSRYFVSLLFADGSKPDAVLADTREGTSYKTGLVYTSEGINPATTVTYNFKVVVAEKNKSILKDIHPSLEDASDTSKWIDPIRMFVVWTLKKMNSVIPNFGWCVVIFSVLSKLILLPLTHKSTQSMKKMSELQPEIKLMKEKYKDKPDIIQKKTMALYKEKGVNPMGGCLPMVVQMPFFIALYSALSNSLDMWNAPFILWITDLSIPETIFSVAGFDFHLLPLLMTGTSFLQQKISATDTMGAGQQQMMMKMMPLFLLFVFWNMPSGLIIYWTIQNMVQVIHQYIVNHIKAKQA